MDWNYYLERKDGKIFYEGYRNSKFYKDDTNWVIEERLPLGKSVASLKMKPDDKIYPVGVFNADVLDKNG